MKGGGTPFIGIGAMRAGTSWLADILESRPDCRMTAVKELHFFDLRYGQYSGKTHYRSLIRSLRSRAQIVGNRLERALDRMDNDRADSETGAEDEGLALQGGPNGWGDLKATELFTKARLGDILPNVSGIIDAFFLRNLNSYVEYVTRDTQGAAAFGEITPAYTLLPAAAFAEIDAALPGAKFIFIMRDPVERLWSQVRFRGGRAAKRHQKLLDPGESFDKALQSPGAVGRSSYHRTIAELESVIPPDRILYFFYETMTSPQTGPAEIRRLEEGLGIEHAELSPKLFTQPVNASPPARLSREREAVALDLLRPVYEFVERRFGRQPGWRSVRS